MFASPAAYVGVVPLTPNLTDDASQQHIPFHAESCTQDLAEQDRILRALIPDSLLTERALVETELRERDELLRRGIPNDWSRRDAWLSADATLMERSVVANELKARDEMLRRGPAASPRLAKRETSDDTLARVSDADLRAAGMIDQQMAEQDVNLRAGGKIDQSMAQQDEELRSFAKIDQAMKDQDFNLRSFAKVSQQMAEQDVNVRAIGKIDADLAASDSALRAGFPSAEAAAGNPDKQRQINASQSFLAGYQTIVILVVALLGIRNIVLQVKRRNRKRKLALEATGPVTVAAFKALEEKYSVVSGSAVIEKWLYLPLVSRWWCGLENVLQAGIFVFVAVVNILFVLITDTDFRGSQTAAWNKVHVVALRMGYMSLAQFPAIFALTGRNSLVQSITGIEYQHLRFVHKLLALFMGLFAVIHTIDASTAGLKWLGSESVKQLYGESYLGKTGIAMLVGLFCSIGFAIRRIRMKYYELFLAVHIVGAILLVVGLRYRTFDVRRLSQISPTLTPDILSDAPTLAPYIYASVAFWAYERVTRIFLLFTMRVLTTLQFRAPLVQAHATLIEGALVLRVPFQGQWGPGQHAYISFWDSAFVRTPQIYGQRHPFSIANVPGSTEVDATGKVFEMMFVMKTRQGMTNIVERKLQASPTGTMPLWVAIEGPYGGSLDTEQFDEILLVAGGSGITHCTSVLADVIHKAKTGRSCSRVRVVKLVWTVQSVEQSIWELTFLLKTIKKAYDAGVKLNVDLFVTRGYHSLTFTPAMTGSRDGRFDDVKYEPEKGNDTLQVPYEPQKGSSTLQVPSASLQLPFDINAIEGPFTGPCPMTPRTVAADLDHLMSEAPMASAVHIIPGRPKINTLVPAFITGARGRSLVVSCGPGTMTAEVRSQVSRLITSYPVQMEMASFEC
ncbi:hypothetical protein P7C70_g3225, partial [Phenoliferia sp. Uapishka_3]